jgi:two-component system CheB/CheR fusion protein
MPYNPGLPSSQDDRAAAAELELQGFSYIVSHDLAASFRHVSEFSRLLLGGLGDGLTPGQQRHADYVRAATSRCQLMLDQLLVFSNLQQKQLVLEHHDATRVMRLAMMRLGAPETESATITIGPLGEVFADGELLGLVFHHLLDNAIKFRCEGVPAQVRVDANHDDGWWRMRVSDHGRGVEPNNRERAFQMFQRLSGGGESPGIGAGLPIGRRIARRHGGELEFIDAEKGACLELTLPRAPAPT